jgi:hypothetical protein
MGYGNVVVHGFRSAFRDWGGEVTAYPSDILESALAHIQGKTRRSYERGDKFPKRRPLMQAWGKYCASSPAKTTADVVSIGTATGAV